MSNRNFNWSEIRPLDGKCDKGFEELCAQLARCESPNNARFIRKGTPDAGVECYTILPDGTEWAWQAKYFLTSPGAKQWEQVSESVHKALEKHPSITKYFVCMPLDRPDGRVDRSDKSTGSKTRTESAWDKWNEHVAKWKATAKANDRDVEFEFWGSHELIERLADPAQVGRVRFWFDKTGFDDAWFSKRLDEALRSAGPRYTQDLHIKLPIAEKLDAIERTETFFDRVKAIAQPIREEFRMAQYIDTRPVTPDTDLDTAATELSNTVLSLLDRFATFLEQPLGPLPFASLMASTEDARTAASNLATLLESREEAHEAHPPREGLDMRANSRFATNPYRNRRIHARNLVATLRQAGTQLQQASELSDGNVLILRGEAGTGKTHLLCDVAQRRIKERRPTVLLMGQRFTSSDEPWQQVIAQTYLPQTTPEEFAGALEAAAQARGTRALIMLDAVNEGMGPTIWPSHMSAFLAQIEKSPWIGVVMTIRSSYVEIVIPDDVQNRAVHITHHGFSGHEYDATKEFFRYYGLELPSTPLLNPEFNNPLFLKTLCVGLHNGGERRIPQDLNGIFAVLSLYVRAANKQLATRLGFDPRDSLVRNALKAFASMLAASGDRWLTLQDAKNVVDALLPNREYERSLYRGMVDEGILIEDIHDDWDDSADDGPSVAIAYDRFADHLVAEVLLDQHFDLSNPAESFGPGGGLEFIGNDDDTAHIVPGLLEALWIQVAERCGKELSTLAPAVTSHWNAAVAFSQSIVWRAVSAFSDETLDTLNSFWPGDHENRHDTVHDDEDLRETIDKDDDLDDILDMLLTVAVLPEHPLNARILDRRLRQDTMADRDAWWSIYLHGARNRRGAVDRLVDWASSLDPETSLQEDVVELAGTALAWMLSSSNRFLRDRATKALVALYSGRLPCMAGLVAKFSDVNDPYVAERIYAAAYGVAMRSHDHDGVGSLAEVVYERVFANGRPPAHILLRDYALGVVERALFLGSSITIDAARIRPPYSSQWPDIPGEDEIQHLRADPSVDLESLDADSLEWAREEIASSVLSGDFARYVIGTNSSINGNWLSATLQEPEWTPPPDSADPNDREPPRLELRVLQRYILKRVFELGWTVERFGHFDRFRIRNSGREAYKAERIGKKYQWIAYHEILALASDRFQYRERYRHTNGDDAYEGPWQEYLRDIDPSCILLSTPGGIDVSEKGTAWWAPISYDPACQKGHELEWARRTEDLPKPEELLIATNPDDGSRWLNAQGNFNWRQNTPADRNPSEVDRGELWYLFTGYLIRQQDANEFLSWAKGVDFMGRWMPEPAGDSGVFLGEHTWAPASVYFGKDGWTTPDQDCPVRVCPAASEFLQEKGTFDCSINEGYKLCLPDRELVAGLGLRWSGKGADFLDQSGALVAQDPTAHSAGPGALLLREDLLETLRQAQGLTLCWTVVGQKWILRGGWDEPHHPATRITGAYVFGESGLAGFVNRTLDDPSNDESSDDDPSDDDPSETEEEFPLLDTHRHGKL